jgi:hypothetical protein
MSGTEKPSYRIAYEPLKKVEHPSALFRFDFEAAESVADNTFADHANYHQQGIALHLYRTETTVFQETKGSFAFVSKEIAWHPQRDLNPCRHLERVVS